eukprot:scaffold8141_cov430-Prasinococcus_capsulatus_cf.AAC.3
MPIYYPQLPHTTCEDQRAQSYCVMLVAFTAEKPKKNHLPPTVMGLTSPYPTVEIVARQKYIACHHASKNHDWHASVAVSELLHDLLKRGVVRITVCEIAAGQKFFGHERTEVVSQLIQRDLLLQGRTCSLRCGILNKAVNLRDMTADFICASTRLAGTPLLV